MKLSLLLPLFLIGCASANGPVYTHSNVPKGQTQLVVYMPSVFGMAMTPEITVAEQRCATPENSYFVKNVQPGMTKLSTGMNGEWLSDFPMSFGPGRHYVEVTLSRGKATSEAFGAVGAGMAELTSSFNGPYYLREVSEDMALKELSTARRACN